jgi:hypothetical protein
MKKETARIWTARLLIGFVVFTIGFSVGRKSAPLPDANTTPQAPETANAGHVLVYAVHMTFRCDECTQIELLTRELLQKEFAREMASGTLHFQTVDYMRDTRFARRYNIPASTVVVVRMNGETETGFQRLDEVWLKVNNREDFFDYVRTAIQTSLDTIEQTRGPIE